MYLSYCIQQEPLAFLEFHLYNYSFNLFEGGYICRLMNLRPD